MENQKEDTPLRSGNGRRLILFPLPLQGHINPMLQLADILHSKGSFSITVVHTRFNSPTASKFPHFTFVPISDGLSETEASTADFIALMSKLNINLVAPLRDCLAGLLSSDDVSEEPSSRPPIACLITDAIWHFSQSVADELEIPRIVLRTSSVSSFLVFAAFPLLREKGYLSKQGDQLESPVVELPPLKVKDLNLSTITTRDPEDLHKLLGGMVREIKASSGLIFNTSEELEHPALITARQDFPVPIFPLGPFHKRVSGISSTTSLLVQDTSSISWLDTQAPKSVLYVSFGSIAAMEAEEFLEMAWGLANSNLPFLWVVRPGSVRGSEWFEPLPDGVTAAISGGGRGYIVKWAPQREVLAHPATGGFWTHNGWNSTLESICEGVPMICSPFFGDQMVNARYVSEVWGLGLRLGREGGMMRGAVEKMTRRVMVEREGDEMRERILGLKQKMKICVEHGGSSQRYTESLITYILSF
ncbi:hypothetical protein U1Q18_026193 [Sarracenia purpurea var. burkii]